MRHAIRRAAECLCIALLLISPMLLDVIQRP